MNINTYIYIFLGFWFLVILWWGLRVMDDRMDLINCNEISAFEVSVVYIMVWGFLVKLGFVWIFAIPVASFVTLLLGKISKNNYIYSRRGNYFHAFYNVLACAVCLTLWIYMFVALVYFLNIFGILLGSGGGMGAYHDRY